MLERYFKLREHNTTFVIEVLAGLATFLTAVYILVVNPLILSNAGMPRDALFTATALSIIIGTLMVGLFANMPFILAPGMGINAFFTYAVVLGHGYTWQEALTGVLISGVVFLLLGVLGIRKILLDGFPEPLKHAMTVSLGLMIAGIGLKNAGILVVKDGMMRLGEVSSGGPLLALIGLGVTGILLCFKLRVAMLLGIIITTVIGGFMGLTDYKSVLDGGLGGVVSLPPSIAPIALQFSFDSARIMTLDFFTIVLGFLVVDVFDSLGTFVGVFNHFTGEEKADYEGRVPRALMCDAGATVAGSLLGVSTVTTFVESSTGIQAGGRTGLTAVAIAFFTFLSLFASGLFLMVPAAATAPALVVVGMFMMNMSGRLNWLDASEGLPAVMMVMVTAMTSSISDGLMFGWIGYMVLKLMTGKFSQLGITVILVGAFFIARLCTM